VAQVNLQYQNLCERAEENYKCLLVSISPGRYLNLEHLEKEVGVLPTLLCLLIYTSSWFCYSCWPSSSSAYHISNVNRRIETKCTKCVSHFAIFFYCTLSILSWEIFKKFTHSVFIWAREVLQVVTIQTKLWPRQLFAGCSLRRPGFSFRPVAEFVVKEVAIWHFFPP
jgi:hypothetical protein